MSPADLAAWVALGFSTLTLVGVLVLLFRKMPRDPRLRELQDKLARVETLVERLDPLLRSEISTLRGEQSRQLTHMGDAQLNQLNRIMQTNNESLLGLTKATEKQLADMREALTKWLQLMQADNADKLEKMRATVDEKLSRTLNERLGESFKLVSDRLEQVQKGLGEMQSLAVGVGDLKKVLTNVKTRGTMGEYQLGAILEQILSPEQYAANVRTNPHSADVVEYAIRLPGKDADGGSVYLPVDSKFPVEAYYLLNAAYDSASPEEIESARRALDLAFRKSAKDIHDKYIHPPDTTDFGILFVPVEGLYAEMVRRPQLLETLQNDYKIVVTGPTTFAALLNSLRMGFQTLAIEKRSSDVWKLLSAVKTEFVKFGGVLESAQKKLNAAGDDLERLVGTRSRRILRHLGQVGQLKPEEASEALELPTPVEEEDEETLP